MSMKQRGQEEKEIKHTFFRGGLTLLDGFTCSLNPPLMKRMERMKSLEALISFECLPVMPCFALNPFLEWTPMRMLKMRKEEVVLNSHDVAEEAMREKLYLWAWRRRTERKNSQAIHGCPHALHARTHAHIGSKRERERQCSFIYVKREGERFAKKNPKKAQFLKEKARWNPM